MMLSNTPPVVSVIMANYAGAAHLADAMESVLAQNLANLELIVVDDHSPDESVSVIQRYCERDARIRLIALEKNLGPAGARNRGLDAATGEWLAIVDNDDLIHPARLRFLIDAAVSDQADIAADDLLIFNDRSPTIGTMMPEAGCAPFWVDAASFVRSNVIYANRPSLGYCKPVIKRRALGRTRYDESLRIGEDSDLLLRLMIAGCRFRIYPELLYFYRKHDGSISHRFSEEDSRRLIAVEARAMREHAVHGPALVAAHAARLKSLERAAAFARLIVGLKARSLRTVMDAVRASPSALLLLRLPLGAALHRRFGAPKPPKPDARPSVVVLSRQRIAGPTNGSSVYLMSIAQFLRRRGFRVSYLSPSPTTFGRWPLLRVVEETRAAFDAFAVRGSVRVADTLLVRDPKVWIRAALSVAEERLLRVGLLSSKRIGAAPYAISQPLTRADCLFLARNARAGGDALLLDYAFLAQARPYALRPDARALIVMHDLFSSRPARFGKAGGRDSVALLEPDEEFQLLAQADGVVAIQSAEARVVGDRLPDRPVILAPMAVTVQDEATPGENDEILFVGSNTAPNVIGIEWFLKSVWPAIRTRCPTAQLRIAGSVERGLTTLPEGATCLGLVPDLAPLYRSAGVVVSPLTVGSGLKIKLIEAMGFGKAIVSTSTTVEGVEALVEGAVIVADEAEAFAAGVCDLLLRRSRRAELAQAALSVARTHFAAEACYGPLIPALFAPRAVDAPRVQVSA